jgi:hypothetical protein
MTDRDKINSWKNLFITDIYEPAQNQLAIEITLGYVSGDEKEIYVGDIHLGRGKQITFDNNSEKYRMYFDSYISYFVLNESFDVGITGKYSGNRIREYEESPFIDFCKKETSGFFIVEENTIKHFAFVTQNHIVNVLTASPCQIQKVG